MLSPTGRDSEALGGGGSDGGEQVSATLLYAACALRCAYLGSRARIAADMRVWCPASSEVKSFKTPHSRLLRVRFARANLLYAAGSD
eukprot:1195063-Rhodomonas_salina.1